MITSAQKTSFKESSKKTAPSKTISLAAQHPLKSPASTENFLIQRKSSCACGGGCPRCKANEILLQPRLKISQPNDIYEQEADELAEKVMRMKIPEQAETDNNQVNKIQRKEAGNNNTVLSAPTIINEVINSPGKPLDKETLNFMEPRFGYDFSNVRIHDDDKAALSAKSINALAYTFGNSIFFDEAQYRTNTEVGKSLLAHELVHIVQNYQTKPATIKRKKSHARCEGVRIILPDTIIFEGNKGIIKANLILMIAMDPSISYTITYNSESDQFIIDPEKDIFLLEFNLEKPEQNDLYMSYRDSLKNRKVVLEVITSERAAIANLPPHIITFLFDQKTINVKNRKDELTILRVASKLQSLTPAELMEYQNRIIGIAEDWSSFEASVDFYMSELKERKTIMKERIFIETKLYNLKPLYDKYNNYFDVKGGEEQEAAMGHLFFESVSEKMRYELVEDFVKAGLPGGISEFENLMNRYIENFERETLIIARILLNQREHILIEEEKKYQDLSNAETLFNAVSNTQAKEDYAHAEAETRMAWISASPAGGGGGGKWTPGVANIAKSKELQIKAETEIRSSAKGHPLVEEGIKFDYKELANAKNAGDMQNIMLSYIKARKEDISKTQENLTDEPTMIYGLDELIETSLSNVPKGSIEEEIIKDHISHVKESEVFKKISLGLIALAAGLLSGGSGTVAVLSAGTATGIGAYQAIEEYENYEKSSAAHGSGLLQENPSFGWVVVAVLGAGFDAAQFAVALPKLKPAIQAFNTGTDEGNIIKLGEKLAKITQVQEEIRKTILKSAEVEVELRAAWKSILKPIPSLKSVVIPGAEEFGRLIYAVYLTTKRGILKFSLFLRTNEAIDLIGDAAKLEPEELALVKAGYIQALKEIENITEYGKSLGMTEDNINFFIKLKAEAKMSHTELKEEMNMFTRGGISIEVTEKQWERLKRISEALNDETKWVYITPNDRWRLGRVYDSFVEKLVSEGIKRTGQRIFHYIEITPKLIADLQKNTKRVLITEGRINGLRFDLLEIDFNKKTAELIDLTATTSPRHIAKTRSGKLALEKILGIPVQAKEMYYAGPKGELLDTLIEVVIE